VENEVPETAEADMGCVKDKDEEEPQNGPGKEGGSDEIVKEEAFPMQEIESLCMRCGENVSSFHFFSTSHYFHPSFLCFFFFVS
jgi:hypothetical protein